VGFKKSDLEEKVSWRKRVLMLASFVQKSRVFPGVFVAGPLFRGEFPT
jgi:hypothetical protein